MRFERAAIALSLLAITSAACERPLTGREFAGSEVREVRVDPEYVRQGVPLRITFRLDGGVQGPVAYSIATKTFECTPERLPDGRFLCTHAGVSRTDYTQGPTDLVVRAKDRRGQETTGTARITLDFDCPEVASLGITPAIGSPGTRVSVLIEATEVLGLPPVISRGGRVWESPLGDGTTWQTDHMVTQEDASSAIDVIVRLVDLAGNTSGDCGVDGHSPFSVDREPPVVVADLIEILRDVPGMPATISADEGAFLDDVGVTEVRVLSTDVNGADVLVATLYPLSDGSLNVTPIPTVTGRARIQAVDVAEQTSPAVLVRERWRLSVGMGEAENAAIRTAVRYTPAPPRTPSLDNRTRELAVSIFTADTQSALVEASVGFKPAGTLPTSYRNTEYIAAGYDKKSRSIVAFGGVIDNLTYRDETVIIRWNELLKTYEHEIFPAVPGQTPAPRAGVNIAFDDNGCGLMFGGYDEFEYFDDIWQVCIGPTGPVWRPIDDNFAAVARFAPILWDPERDRFVTSFGATGEALDSVVEILDPGDRSEPWRWVPMTELPRDFVQNYRVEHAFYYDTAIEGYVAALGFTNYYVGATWSFSRGVWTESDVPFDLWSRYGFGFAYDRARSHLAVWGDGRDVAGDIDDDTWLLVGDPRGGAQAWRRIDFAPAVIRASPTLVYDEDRETVVIFGGRRRFDTIPVPPDIDVLITPPSYPYLEADLDLDDVRPAGIANLVMNIRADGGGDGDGVGPGTTIDGGVIVYLWNHDTKQWDEVAVVETPPAGPPVSVPITVAVDPARYLSTDGVVPVAISSRYPATEEVSARLEVDLVDGYIELSAVAAPGAKIVAFEAAPEIISSGGEVELSWIARDAPQGIELRTGTRILADSVLLEGSLTDTPTVTTTYTLIAKNAASGNATATRTVTVKPPIAPPLVLSFYAEEAAAPRGGTAHLHWTTDRATSVRILRGDTEIHRTSTDVAIGAFNTGLPAGVMTSTTFRIEAIGAAGSDERSDTVLLANSRILVGPNRSDVYSEGLAVPGEHDLYIVEMTAPGYIEAIVHVPAEPECTGVDTYMRLLDHNLDSLGGNDEGGVNSCSAFVRGTDDFILVGAGTYYVELQDYYDETVIPAYTLEITTTPIACGNGVVEPSEGCDDGNTTPNDGCSAVCRLEVDGTYSAPASGRVVFPGAIVAGDIQVFELNVTAPTLVSMETFIPSGNVCPTGDTEIELFAADQATLIERDDDDGPGYCSVITTLLDIGTYYLVVHELGDNLAIPAYELVIDSVAGVTLESEPNDVAGEATSLGVFNPGGGSGTFAASINPAGDEDWFSFVLSQSASVRITTFSSATDQNICTNDNVMVFYDAGQNELSSEDDVNGSCAVLDGITPVSAADMVLSGLPAGTYYVRMTAYSAFSTIGAYFLALETQ